MISLNRIPFRRLALIVLLTGVLLTIVLTLLITQLVAAADEALNVRSRYDGTYGIVSAGVGFEAIAPGGGDIVLDIPGPPVQAFLTWAGQDTNPPGGDNAVLLSVNGGPTNPITALRSYGPEYWNGTVADPPIRNSHVWVADVTALVLQGTNTYTVSEFGPMYAEFGAGLLVVYEDGALPYSFAEIVEGLDGAYHNYPSPRGPDTEVACVQFAATGSPRTMNLSFFVGGVNISGGPGSRPNSIWYQTGTGATPSNLVNQLPATEIGGQPLDSLDGEEWDTYQDSITVSAGDTYACFQIESPPPDGASLLWVNLSVSMAQDAPTDTPTPTNTFTPTPTNTFTPTPTNTPPAATDTPTPTSTSTDTPVPTDTSTPTSTSTGTLVPTDTSTPTSTFTPGPTSTFTAVPSNTPSSTPGNTPTPGPTTPPSPSPTASSSSSTLPSSGIGGEFGLPTLFIMGVTSSAIVFLARYLRKRLAN